MPPFAISAPASAPPSGPRGLARAAPQAQPLEAAGAPPGPSDIGPILPGLDVRLRVGQGRTGNEFVVFDEVRHRQWTLKEYLPPMLAHRRDERVEVLAPQLQAPFDEGLQAFVDEARWLTARRHPALRQVHQVWRAHGTAYATLQPKQGATLLRHLARLPPGGLSPAWVGHFLRAVAGALEVMHGAGRLHRGVHPGEVMVTAGGEPLLLGLGTMQLRRADGTPLFAEALRDGFAAPEQYRGAATVVLEGPPLTEGPWTDLYSLAAIAYGMLTGVALEPAPLRAAGRCAPPAERLARVPEGRFDARLLQGVERTLALQPAERPQTVAEFLQTCGLAPVPKAVPLEELAFLFKEPAAPPARKAEAHPLDVEPVAHKEAAAAEAAVATESAEAAESAAAAAAATAATAAVAVEAAKAEEMAEMAGAPGMPAALAHAAPDPSLEEPADVDIPLDLAPSAAVAPPAQDGPGSKPQAGEPGTPAGEVVSRPGLLDPTLLDA